MSVDHCELCGVPLYLVEERDGTICGDCRDKRKADKLRDFAAWKPCPCCGRTHEHQFRCNRCFESVCNACVGKEHSCSAWEDF